MFYWKKLSVYPPKIKALFLVLGLGTTCTIGYGTIFYSFSLLSIEIENHFSWGHEFIYGIYSLGVLLSGLLAPVICRCLDYFGVRYPMSLGSLLVALSFYGLSVTDSQWMFAFCLLLMEVISILVLYESAFVALTHLLGSAARLPISQITLMAGFASTIFWPLVSWLLTITDWRVIYSILGLLHLLICLPIHYCVLKEGAQPSCYVEKETSTQPSASSEAVVDNSLAGQWQLELLMALAFGLVAFCISGLQIHVFTLLSALSLSDGLALAAAALIGPFQIVSRVTDIVFGQRLNPIYLGVISVAAMAIGILALLAVGMGYDHFVFLFASFFGLGQGLTYIVRGAIPLYLFGQHQYGTITGRINSVRMIMAASAPLVFSLLIEQFSAPQLLCLLAGVMGLSILLLYCLPRSSVSTNMPNAL